jgi:hypothetical protein
MTRTKTTLTALTSLAALALPLALATGAYADNDRGRDRDDRHIQRHDRAWGNHARPGAFIEHRSAGLVRPILGLVGSLIADNHCGPVVVRTAPRGHWATVTRQVLVEAGHWELQSTPAVYECRRDWRGRLVQACVRPAETVRVWIADRYQTVVERVWVCD